VVEKAEIVTRPGTLVLAVIVMPLLNVPVLSKLGFCNCNTDWLKLKTKS
jgi:hypothetical protein